MRIDETSATAPPREQRLTGIGVSPGIAIGPAYLGDRGELPVSETRIAESAIDSERDRFAEAVATSIKQLRRLKTRAAALPGSAADDRLSARRPPRDAAEFPPGSRRPSTHIAANHINAERASPDRNRGNRPHLYAMKDRIWPGASTTSASLAAG
jgi:phosphotransferase system enzyme I (PtsI)